MKPKTCKICKDKFEPNKSTQVVCSPKCAIEYSKIHLKKVKLLERKETIKKRKELKEKIKTKGAWLNDLQKVFNTFIRLRDKDKPCISCGTRKEYIKYDAGHYITVGSSPALRFNEDNVHKQCSKNCNNEKHGNIVNYRIRLVKRIGVERVELLESKRSEPKHYSIEEIKEMIKIYRLKIKELENN